MKRYGFTLAEILIAVGIIGVLAAVTLPMVNKYSPDTTKALYLNTYDSLAQIMESVLYNDKIYATTNANGTPFNYYPLANLSDTTKIGGHNIKGGQNKFCRVLAEGFNIIEDLDNIKCSDDKKLYSTSSKFEPSFTNKNGVLISVATTASIKEVLTQQSSYLSEILIDVNGDKAPNCLYSTTCTTPDRFMFYVTADGSIFPADEMGIFYLESRSNLAYKDINDISEAEKTIINDINTKNNKFTKAASQRAFYLNNPEPIWEKRNKT